MITKPTDAAQATPTHSTNGLAADARPSTQHVRGVTEYFGDTAYNNPRRGVAQYHVATAAESIGALRPSIYHDEGGYTGSIEVYKGTSLLATPQSHSLVHRFDHTDERVLVSTDPGQLSAIQLPNAVNLQPGEYLFVYFRSGCKMRIWSTQAGTEPFRPDQFILEKPDGWGFSRPGYRYATPLFVEASTPGTSDAATEEAPMITLPNVLYAAQGVEFSLYYDNYVLGIDGGLHSPKNYHIEALCDVGKCQQRRFTIKARAADVGDHVLTVVVYCNGQTSIASRQITLRIVPNTPPAPNKQVICMGDSLMFEGDQPLELDALFHNLGSNVPALVGAVGGVPGASGNTVRWEGRSGWGWDDSAGPGRKLFRFDVSNQVSTTPDLKSVYANNGSEYTLLETNLPGFVRGIRSNNNVDPEASGTLTRTGGNGPEALNFVFQGNNPGNPFWNIDTGQLDMAFYKQTYGITGAIDVLSCQYGINDVPKDHFMTNAETETIVGYITTFVNFVLSDEPDCTVVLPLPTTDGSDMGGYGQNYGATQSKRIFQHNIYKLRQAVLATFDGDAFSPRVKVTVTSIDRWYGYEREVKTDTTYAGYGTTEERQINGRHPYGPGYREMATHLFPIILATLQA